ncbi:hypothetical protein EW145_g6627 [Phellinidium pouzarii]|uniref:Uncharacterized protein n=1 Tax=Phellinidium pouzarii TaxID=167371 RepID=A0A4S4L0R5_9AGAM|nr:hypothetical protein EW145_g6627 [Phellinidium pouzarii]
MARGGHSPMPVIPKVSFTKIEDDASTQPAGVHDQQARSYGYNDFSTFQRPEHYLRHIEPLDSELAVQVEYDMDEQDQEWLDTINNERRNEQLNKVSYEAFEIIMDRLEKEWFDLTKNIPKPDMALPSEDSTCAICDDAEGENSNAIVFCDGCNLAVHQDCYGVPYIPEGQWLCRKCTVSPENPVTCILCPNEGGAFKQTVSGDWAHLLCAIWVPETRVANDVFMEPITGVDRINKQRWKLTIKPPYLRQKEQLAIHEAALAELDEASQELGPNLAGGVLTDIHTPRSSKKARAYAKTYRLGAPLVPAIIVRRLLEYIGRINIRKKQDFVHLMCRYWSLKREARRGAPLLKRLHLEPWTVTVAGKAQTEEEIAIKLEYLKLLRKDLEAVRMLAELTRKREMQKLRQAQVIHDVVSTVFFPHSQQLRIAFERIESLDRHEVFKNPVSRATVPDYFDVIKRPMCWKTIDAKLDANEYWNVKDFRDDVNLVLDNAMLYNKLDTPIYRAAMKIKASATHILDELLQLARHIPSDSPEAGKVGDLEPPLSVLDLLTSIEAVDKDLPFLLEKDPLNSLFSYELEKLKPPPPPKPPKPKRDRRAEAERRKQRLLNKAPGFRAPPPRTRRALAEVEAFEAEARGTSKVVSSPNDVGGDGYGENEGDEEGSLDGRGSRNGRRWRRPPVVLPGQTEVPPVVDDVDTQRWFDMFDAGWILPSNTRRGGRAPIEKHELPPPRKRSRTALLDRERQHSTLSYSTPTTENLTLREESLQEGPSTLDVRQEENTQSLLHKRENSETVDLSGPSPTGAHPDETHDEPMDVTVEAATVNAEPGAERSADSVLEPETQHEPEPEIDRPLRSKRSKLPPKEREVIEELDTPATRLTKTERGRQKAASNTIVTSPPTQRTGEERSELSSLSDLSEVEDESEDRPQAADVSEDLNGSQSREVTEERRPDGRIVVAAEDAREAARAAGLGPAMLWVNDGEVLEGGTLVWAKAETYPWWPAVVYEEDDPDVPAAVLKEKKPTPRAGGGPLLLVQFWDARKTWQWLPMDKLRLLNEDTAWDKLMLNGSTKVQRFKTAKVKEQCRAAWRSAMAEMETSNMESEEVTSEQAMSAGRDLEQDAEDGAMAVDTGDPKVLKTEN